jgi:NAD(P)-dependent dehydrogenase (short-subunit alcohol dehydrogenase family)
MLASEGYALTLTGRRPAPLDAAAGALAAEGKPLLAVAANVAEESEVVRLVRAHEERWGRLDVLVSCAGIAVGGVLEGFQTKLFDLQTGVNVKGPFLLMRECAPLLRRAGAEHGEALVVNISSIVAKYAHGGAAVYAATKHALVGLTQSFQQEVRDAGVKATVVSPGFVDTPALRRQFELIPEWVGNVAPAQMIQPADVAEAVRFLLRLSRGCLVPELVLGRATAYPGIEP